MQITRKSFQLIFIHQRTFNLFSNFFLDILVNFIFLHNLNEIKIFYLLPLFTAHARATEKPVSSTKLFRTDWKLNWILFSTQPAFFFALVSLSRYKKKKIILIHAIGEERFCIRIALHRCLREIMREKYLFVCAIKFLSDIFYGRERERTLIFIVSWCFIIVLQWFVKGNYLNQ